MHPIERLRYVARAGPVPMGPLVRESAGALAAFADDPGALLMACRRLLDRRPHSGPLVWLAARMLTGPDPRSEAWDAVEDLERDPTPKELEHAIPGKARVLVIGAPASTGVALEQRPDLNVMVVETSEGDLSYWSRLEETGGTLVDVPESGIGAAAAECDVVLLESECIGPDTTLVPAGSLAAAATGRDAGAAVWLVAGVGRMLPARMWDGVIERVDRGEPWDSDYDQLPLRLVDRLVTPVGLRTAEDALRGVDCPVAPELFGAT